MESTAKDLQMPQFLQILKVPQFSCKKILKFTNHSEFLTKIGLKNCALTTFVRNENCREKKGEFKSPNLVVLAPSLFKSFKRENNFLLRKIACENLNEAGHGPKKIPDPLGMVFYRFFAVFFCRFYRYS